MSVRVYLCLTALQRAETLHLSLVRLAAHNVFAIHKRAPTMPSHPPAQTKQPAMPSTSAWEGTAAEISEVVEHALRQKLGERHDLGDLARHVVVGICDTIGGIVCYLPRGEAIKRAMRDESIYKDWQTGEKPAKLARKYRLSGATIYDIIARQRAIRAKLQ